jgi:AraC-like DNA-binding protein/mannose-6-phosphate isomerase-like protein (cupin superfamily)
MLTYRADELIKKGESFHIFFKPTDQTMEEHTHDFIEIVYVSSGKAIEHIDGARYEVSRGDLVFINYGCTHRFEAVGDFAYTNICFRPEVLGDGIITAENAFSLLQLTAFDEIRRDSDAGVVHFGAVEREDVERLLAAMSEEYRSDRISRRTMLESYLNILFVKILRKITAGEGAADGEVWRELSDYIDKNLGGELTLSALAGKCFYNPSYFSRAFKERFGVTLTEYINRRKVEAAAALAADKSLSSDAVAARVGFSSGSALSRAFYKVHGVSFSDFRRQK